MTLPFPYHVRVLSPGNWEDSITQPDGYVIHWLIEVDTRYREVVLTAECECGHTFTERAFDHPEQAFEVVDDLTCPDLGTEHHTDD